MIDNRLKLIVNYVGPCERWGGDSTVWLRFDDLSRRAGRDLGVEIGVDTACFWQICMGFYLIENGCPEENL